MPNKHNVDRPHYFGKMKFKGRNWASHEVGLWRRGNLTFWVTDDAIAIWQTPPRETSYRFYKLLSRFEFIRKFHDNHYMIGASRM
jgi:hypothetical protein